MKDQQTPFEVTITGLDKKSAQEIRQHARNYKTLKVSVREMEVERPPILVKAFNTVNRAGELIDDMTTYWYEADNLPDAEKELAHMRRCVTAYQNTIGSFAQAVQAFAFAVQDAKRKAADRQSKRKR